MAWPNTPHAQLGLGATFIPGQGDTYYMPEVISPAPQRVMPELSESIQGNLSHLENQTRSPDQARGAPDRKLLRPNSQQFNGQDGQPYKHVNQPYDSSSPNLYQNQSSYSFSPPAEQPNFSPFPVLRNPPPNVPPTDDQKEATLEAAREAVLASNDPETQLVWAQDALSFVEVAMQNELRVSATQPPRPRTPRVEHMLKEDAMKVVNFLADQHHPKAEFLRGMWLEFGKFGYRVDKKEAFHCYSRASEKGYRRAEYRIGMQFESSNDALKAIKHYQKGADAADSACCYRLGMMTLLGQHGQPQNFEHGLNMIFSSAQTADENAPQGAYVFGMLQARELAQVSIPERFLPLDIAGAKINIEKAAYLGFAKAQVKMGSAYELCELGCDFDPALSLHYNALAARQGEADAEMAISKWFLCGHEGLFEKSEEVAFTFAQRSALSGLSTAQFAMGYFYEVGIYVPVNYREAKEWYNKAAANGNKDASTRIDCISRSKTLSRKDHERVAISKIRQQYGSQAQTPGNLPPIPQEPALDMPDASRLSLQPPQHPTSRPSSAAPYPGRGAPSPLPRLPNQGSPYLSPELRPSSAFGINPNLRPNSAVSTGGPRPDHYVQSDYPPQGRPYSSAETAGGGFGGGRLPPADVSMPQGRGQGRPEPGPPRLNIQTGQTRPTQIPPRVDIGYTAPLDAAGPGRGHPASRPTEPYGSKFQLRPPRTSSRPGPSPSPSPTPAPGIDKYYQGKPNSQDQRPPAKVYSSSNIPPSIPTNYSNNRPVAAQTKPTVVPASGARPPKKGPKTFEEMGVPQVKSDSDCVVM